MKTNFLNNTLSPFRLSRFLPACVGAALAIASVTFLFWRAQFGVELYDEPFYLTPGFKMFALGDKPLAHEAHNGLRQFDVLNRGVAVLGMPLDVLVLRRAAIALYAVLLGLLTWLAFRKRFGLAAGLAFSACLLFDHFVLPTWSHNWWVRNLLIAHHCLILLAAARFPRVFFALAGACAGLVVFAYHPLFFGTAFVVLALSTAMGLGKLGKEAALARAYATGLLTVGAAAVVYVGRESVRADWLHAVSVNVLDYASGKKISFEKIRSALSLLALSRETWLLLLLLAAGTALNPLYAKLKLTEKKRDRVRAAVATVFALFLFKRFIDSHHFFMISQLFIGAGAVAGVWGFFTSKQSLFHRFLFLALPLVLAANMSFVSHNSHHALFWLVPILLVPFIANQLHDAAVGKYPAVRFTLVLGLLAVVSVGAIRHTLSSTYFDANIKDCVTKIDVAPLKGIYTTRHRAELISELARVVEGKKFALAIGLPGAFYFGNLRSSGDTLILNPSFPEDLARGALHTMVRDNRAPELVIVERQNNWSWGLEPLPTILETVHPYARFASCVNRGVLLDVPEFYILDADPSRAEICAENAFDLLARRG